MLSTYVKSASKGVYLTSRLFHSGNVLKNSNSLFGSITSTETPRDKVLDNISQRLETSMENPNEEDVEEGSKKKPSVKDTLTPANDKQLQDFIKSKRPYEKPASEILLSPLKRQIYELNCKQNGGFYMRDRVVTIPSSKDRYKLHLSKEEIETLEPSMYLQSYRIKSTMKKATKFLRMFQGMGLKSAITQCHFTKKGLGIEIGDLLEDGLQNCGKLGLDPNNLYISQIWTGSDGSWMKRVDIKGRGRLGIITHRYIHVKCILKDKNVTLKRLEYEKQLKQEKKKPVMQLRNEPIRGVPGAAYKW